MPGFKLDTVYSDVEHYTKHGYWPNRSVPDWAEERAKYYDCFPTNAIILDEARKNEIERLKKILEDINNNKKKFLFVCKCSGCGTDLHITEVRCSKCSKGQISELDMEKENGKRS